MAEKNSYTEALDRIKAPEESVNRAVNAALEAEQKRGKSHGKAKTKSALLKITAAAAAFAVVTGAVTAAVMVSRSNKRNSGSGQIAAPNSFSLSVNAAELNKSSVNIGKIVCGQSMMACKGKTPDANTDISADDDTDNTVVENFTMSPELSFAVNCRGNNIKYINYQIEGAAFCPMELDPVEELSTDIGYLNDYNRYNRILEMTFNKPYDELIKEVDHGPDSPETPAFVYAVQPHVYSSLTLRYDDQPLIHNMTDDELFEQYSIDGPPSLDIITKGVYSWDPELSGVSKELSDHIIGKTFSKLDEFDSASPETEDGKLKKAFITEQIENIKITITVTYEDGDTDTCIMQLSPGKQSEDTFEMDVNAKLIMVKEESSNTESDPGQSGQTVSSPEPAANNKKVD